MGPLRVFRPAGSLRSPELGAFDAAAEALRRACAERFELGRTGALDDIDTLCRLDRSIGRALAHWEGLCGALLLVRAAPFDRDHARAVVLETVFDPILEPEARRVLRAAIVVAQ